MFSYDLFISYAAADEAWVEGFLLPELGLPEKRIITKESFILGANKIKEYERAVKSSRYTVIVFSQALSTDIWATFSEQIAESLSVEEQSNRLIPLRLANSQSLFANHRVSLDCTHEAKWKDEVGGLRAWLEQPEPEPEKIACPYPGMRAFREKESTHFYGRDREIGELVQTLRSHSLQAVIGPSGSGKSSLVFAGLVPALRKSGRFGEGSWLIRMLRPAEEPLKELATTLNGDLSNVKQDVASLLAKNSPAQRLLLIVDQFEETFTTAETKERKPFQEALMQLREVNGCYLVLTVRAAFYEELMSSPIWPAIKDRQMKIVPLNREGLHEAIKRPAEAKDVGVFIEPTLIERLVADAVGEPGMLPFLQETLNLLWEKLERRYLPLKAYEALVELAEKEPKQSDKRLTGLQVAMKWWADAALAELAERSEQHKAMARRIFLSLVQFGEGRPNIRRQQLVTNLRSPSDDKTIFDETVQLLTEKRLLTVTGEIVRSNKNEDKLDIPQRKVDLAHEALITGWPTLQEWLTEFREVEQSKRRFESKADEWIGLGQGSGGYLDQAQLREYERWLEKSKISGLRPNEKLVALVKYSRRKQRQWQIVLYILITVFFALVLWAFYVTAIAKVAAFQ